MLIKHSNCTSEVSWTMKGENTYHEIMLIYITVLFIFCSGDRMQELKDVLTSVPEIRDMIGDEHIGKYMSIKETDPYDETKVVLQSIYTKLMSTSEEAVSKSVSKLKHRLNIESKVIWISRSYGILNIFCYEVLLLLCSN